MLEDAEGIFDLLRLAALKEGARPGAAAASQAVQNLADACQDLGDPAVGKGCRKEPCYFLVPGVGIGVE